MKELIQRLSDMRGISGFEYRITDDIVDILRLYTDEVRVDALGSVIAVRRCGKENAKKIMIEAHYDEIGLIVTSIDERGFLTFAPVGGVDPRILPASEVIVHGKRDIQGIIGAKPPHLQGPDEAKKSVKMRDMAIDVGMDYEEVIQIVSVGDSVTFPQSVGELGNCQFTGKSLDDRASLAALIEVMKRLQKVNLEADVYVCASVQEEVGLRGATTAAYGIEPDLAVAVDVCHGITPDNSDNAFEVGSGCIISVGPNIHPKLQERLSETAAKYHIKTEIDVDGGDTGTDAWAIQVTRSGIPTALLSIPLKYMHTSVETLSLEDVEAVADLLTFFIQDFSAEQEEWLCC